MSLIKIKANFMGVRESGQHRIRVWEQRGHLASLQHPVSPSYHSKSILSFQPSLPELSSHHAVLLLTLFLPAWLGRRIECHVPGCLWCFANMEMKDGGREEGKPHCVNPEHGSWTRPPQNCGSLWEGRPPPAALPALASCP